MWIIYSILVHILLLGSIFVIYFRSPVITGLHPQPTLKSIDGLEPPAKRLVLIVTDGLRAESFFQNNCNNVPHLRKIFKEEGLVGVSRTRVPTESRPGHIALIAGLYEDPSAVTRGWKSNPIDFDNLFNRSAQTYAWGNSDVLGIFSKLADSGRPLHFDSYDDLDFSGKDKTYHQDQWVFERVPLLLQRKQNDLQNADQVVFFLHLLGLDTAGHVHKPGTKLFLENLNYTERGIAEIYELFERTFPDKRTSYLMTSDHGMTNSGSHGAGDPHETDTPFILWGAGVAKRGRPIAVETFNADNYTILPLYELEQAQLTPLMSALIGLPPPMNNFGILPINYINASAKYEAYAMHINTLQILTQYEQLLLEHNRGLFTRYLNCFPLSIPQIDAHKTYVKQQLKSGYYEDVIRVSLHTMHEALEGIDYYHGYYRNMLLVSTTATFLGWILYLVQLVLVDDKKKQMTALENIESIKSNSFAFCAIGACLLAFVKMQKVSFVVGFYLILPLPIWMLALHGSNWREIKKSLRSITMGGKMMLLIACTEFLVFSFFDRRLISAGFLLHAAMNSRVVFKREQAKSYLWLFMISGLAIFPFMPSVGYQNSLLLALGFVITAVRPTVTKTYVHWRINLCNIGGLANAALCIYLHSNLIEVTPLLRMVSWGFIGYAFTSILTNPVTGLKQRVNLIFFNLSSLYAFLCTSYEALFIQILALELIMSVDIHHKTTTPRFMDKINKQTYNLQNVFWLSFVILLYALFSLFGTGNIASISSFDPNVMRCFLTEFSPFKIMGLVILKLIIPALLIVSIIFGLSEFARLNERKIFICMLLICDIMGMNFLYFVRNKGSWLEIGSSISHFVIMEVLTLGILLLTLVAKAFLKMPFTGIADKLK